MNYLNMKMSGKTISNWIQNSFTSELSDLAIVTIRADGMIKNGACVHQGAWSTNATNSIQLLIGALDRTISHLNRGDSRDMKFIAFLGGEKERGVAGHFHALLQFPPKVDKQIFMEKFKYLWSIKASDALKTTLRTSVFAEPIKSREAYAAYCLRIEGTTFNGGSDKVVMSRSLKM